MTEFILPILIFLVVGCLAGVILTAASKLLAVKTDDTVERLLTHLPGINCGACGYSGCEGYANAIAKGKAEPTLCKPGGEKTAKGIGEELGIEVKAAEKEVAYVHCSGDCDATKDKYNYNGTLSCLASEKYYNGKGQCRFSCTGLGDCTRVCEYGAISVKNGVAVVNNALCTACGLCIKECPNKLISFRKVHEKVQVSCSSQDIGKTTKANCKNGCIACKICEKKCPSDAIHVVDNRAVIDYAKCTGCEICVEVCPTKCIHVLPECVK